MSDLRYAKEKLATATLIAKDRSLGTLQERAEKAFKSFGAIMADDLPQHARPAFERLHEAVFPPNLPEADRFPQTVRRMSDDRIKALLTDLTALNDAV